MKLAFLTRPLPKVRSAWRSRNAPRASCNDLAGVTIFLPSSPHPRHDAADVCSAHWKSPLTLSLPPCSHCTLCAVSAPTSTPSNEARTHARTLPLSHPSTHAFCRRTLLTAQPGTHVPTEGGLWWHALTKHVRSASLSAFIPRGTSETYIHTHTHTHACLHVHTYIYTHAGLVGRRALSARPRRPAPGRH